ncbi:transcriptional repressor [Sulfurimonas sp.]|uniref:transcriptional repressor n=1 Tax=Sulfurimonas sp. TaxID=2022749 RepID=UPI0025FCEB83|nr:transcriptional repressor [Sulfurimonas sp.]
MSIEKLNECIKSKKANHSRSREVIYNLLLNSNECLSVSQITKELSQTYPKKLSLNSLYRHLNFFIESELVIVIQDDYKRAYYHLKENNPMFFNICTNCTNIKKLDYKEISASSEFIDAEFITIHKKCEKCKQK